MPQGITGTTDASPDNRYHGIQGLAVTSYNHSTNDAQVTFLPNFSEKDSKQPYQHIRLVEAVKGGKSKPVKCHAGGAVWYGDYLLVGCTHDIKVFDWRKVYDPVGAPYEMIQVGSLDTKKGVQLKHKIVFSSLSLDRASNSPLLAVAEYDTDCKEHTCQVIRFALPAQPADLTNRGKPVPAHDAYRHFYGSMQGAISRGDMFWFTSSGGPAHNDPISEHYGTLRSWHKGDKQAQHYEWAYGAEGISYRSRGDNAGEIMTVTEWKRHRVIVAVSTKHFS
ncbi:MAG: hypothetical protein LC776_12905 [Acidobacteria bacterium]|nr:hypothetical protein [Acidobacteriota bacterium]